MNTKSRIIQTLSLCMALVTLLALTGACSVPPAPEQVPGQQNAPPTPEFGTTEIEPGKQVSPGDLVPREPSDCPDLDSSLFQIIQAPDPLDAAEQLQLQVRGDKVKVLLILDREDTGFLRDFGVEIGTQSGTQVQAFVPINQLCDLANTDEVLAIRPPAQAASQ
jgi:hypothetical protein